MGWQDEHFQNHSAAPVKYRAKEPEPKKSGAGKAVAGLLVLGAFGGGEVGAPAGGGIDA